ncbi:hypothetical protein ACJMK2_014870 [Sinanodonta woodiana]|uniref:Septin-type G domain-containing protein n=1 Tax=Sinanodonta woodiana TaxID=1069815 RepID=A0ABD3V4Q1_SINWO
MDLLRSVPRRIRAFKDQLQRNLSEKINGVRSRTGEDISDVTLESDEIPGHINSARELSGPNSQSASGPFSSLFQLLKIGAHNPSDGKPTIKRLQLTVNENSVNLQAKTRKCVFGNRSSASFREKTVMVVGGTGAGKSTMINSVVNHILGIQWEDNVRLTVIDLTQDEMENSRDESNSQTKWITCYIIPEDESKLDYTLNIIDTPGFGDTRGIDGDRELVDHLRMFFNSSGEQGIKVLDAVWFVAKSSDTRLTHSERYVFDSILSIFGKDIGKSIFVLATFADNKNPPVLNTLNKANVPFQNAFAFNNSALFENQEDHEMNACGQHYWKRNTESFRQLFEELGKTERHSIQLSAEVLKIRKQLETTIQGMHMHIHDGLTKMDTIKQETNIVKNHAIQVSANKDFEYEVIEYTVEKIPLKETGTFVTNCTTCNSTCHYPCRIPRTEDKADCSAMYNGKCTVCINKCVWNQHYNSEWRFETNSIKIKKTYDEIKKRYVDETKELKTHQEVLESMIQGYKETERNVSDSIKRARESLNRLKMIALKEDPLSHVDYIDMLIKCEQREKKPRFLERVDMLEVIKQQAQCLANLSDGNPLTGFLDKDS